MIWLNEAQHYLKPTRDRIGEHVAAELRNLLRERGRGPVLILATLWPEYWDELTKKHDPPQDVDQVHAQARDLLTRTYLPVPSTFTGQDLKALTHQAKSDARLHEAVNRAEQSQITQYLAGGPALIERYETAPPAAKAIIEAAMDARRLGHDPALPLVFLEACVPGYLTELQWDNLSDNWLEQALTYVTAPCHGARAPLTRIRPRPGEDPRTTDDESPRFRLADYLEQHARTHRLRDHVPGPFWAAATAYTRGNTRRALGTAAHSRGLLRIAFHLYTSTLLPDNGVAPRLAAEMLRKAGRTEQALSWYQRAANASDTGAFLPTAEMLLKLGRLEEALSWYQRAADAGDTSVLHTAPQSLRNTGHIDEALTWYQRAADAGDTSVTFSATLMLKNAGRIDEALTWCQRAADAGDIAAPGRAAEILQEAGRTDEALALLHASAEAGNTACLGQVATMLWRAGRAEEALTWFLRAADTNDTAALVAAAEILQSAGYLKEAIAWLQTRTEVGDDYAFVAAARILLNAGHLEEALTWIQGAADSGVTRALFPAAQMLQALGYTDEAITWYQRAADADGRSARLASSRRTFFCGGMSIADAKQVHAENRASDRNDPLWSAARICGELGRTEHALTWLQVRADAGDAHASWCAAEMLQDVGRVDEALAWYQRAAGAGHHQAPQSAAEMLEHVGRMDEALTWYQHVIDSGNTDAVRLAAEMLRRARGIDEALTWYQRAADTGIAEALPDAVDLLRMAGRTDEADRLQRNGWDPGGHPAAPWDASAPTDSAPPEASVVT